ncbi:MAG: hypothetical protein ABFS14_00695 [Gemmatimonadota bacterium]
MRVSFSLLLSALLMGSPTILLAQSGQAEGQYSSHVVSADTAEMADGSMALMFRGVQSTFADNEDHPLDNQRADCVGHLRISADGSDTSGSGACFSKDADLDGVSYWWVVEEGGTEACPGLCGSFAYYGGYGKYEGMSGDGSWHRTDIIGDLSTGTWESSYSIP